MLINANSIDRQLIFFFVTIILERFVISMPAWTKSYFSPRHKFINFSIVIPPLLYCYSHFSQHSLGPLLFFHVCTLMGFVPLISK